MEQITLLADSQEIKFREPLVLVPLSLWRKAEELLEDQEALASKRYLLRVERAREDIRSNTMLKNADNRLLTCAARQTLANKHTSF